MADFLATFNFAAETQAPPSDREVNSVEDLQSRLVVALQAKTTPTRAEHVSLALELRSTARFTIALSDGDNRALEGLDTIDPSLGGLSSSQGGATRTVTANETLMNQSDNPVLQRSVAKVILGAVSATDASTWMLRDLTRGSQGWTFTYICKDSHQHWNSQTAKNPPQAIIGEYSLQDPDPVLMGKLGIGIDYPSCPLEPVFLSDAMRC